MRAAVLPNESSLRATRCLPSATRQIKLNYPVWPLALRAGIAGTERPAKGVKHPVPKIPPPVLLRAELVPHPDLCQPPPRANRSHLLLDPAFVFSSNPSRTRPSAGDDITAFVRPIDAPKPRVKIGKLAAFHSLSNDPGPQPTRANAHSRFFCNANPTWKLFSD